MPKTRLSVCLLIILMIGLFSVLSAQSRQISISNGASQTRLLSGNDFGMELQFNVGELRFETVQTRGGSFDEISIEGFSHSNRIGEPKLPVSTKIVAVPIGAELSFEVISRQSLRLDGSDSRLQHKLLPVQLSVSKSDDPALLPFKQNEELYNRDEFTGGELFRIEEIGYMRGLRLFQFYFEPIRYNPVSGELQVTYDATIRVNFNNPDLIATQDLLARTASYEYEALYAQTVFNWDASTRASLVRYPTKMLILCPPNYTDEMAPFVTWKQQQGYNVTVTTVGTGGTIANTTAAINTYMASVWSAATAQDPAPTYLIIVGDTSTSGDNIIANTGATGSHVTDLTYVRLNGTDYVPDMYYGRFSVASGTELTNAVNKTITFEKTQMPDLTYLGKAVMIAGVDSGFGPTHGNGAINYGTTNYFNSSQGITSNTYLYPASGSSDATIIANANEGRGYINYTAHGSETSWADPTFSVSDVNSMTNTNKYGVMVGNCCVTNAFGTDVCFGESIIRKANAGGVAYIGGTNNTYWDEDYWWAVGAKGTANGNAPAYDATKLGAYDAMFHTHSEAFTDWAQTTGDAVYMGNLAVAQGNSSRTNYYWEIYSIMGDPSLMPYFGVPTVNTATFPSTILIGASSITVTATPYSRVALSMGGTLYGTGIVPAGGSLTLAITPFSTTGTANLVITAQDKITRIENITIAPNSGPYVNVSAIVYSDTNNSSPEYNETGRFSPTFHNVGSVTATNVTATLSCSTPGFTISDGTENIASLAAGATSTINNAFTFGIPNGIADGTMAAFTITMVSGSNTWVHNFTLEINAPALVFANMTISDPSGNNNGRLDPGETVTVTMPLNNTGGASSPSGTATLSCATPGITINTGTANFAAISAGGNANLSFSITAAAGMTIGTIVNINFNATAGSYTASKAQSVTAGIILEDFETGNFNSFSWVMGGTLPWVIDNTTAQTGTYSAKSGAITHSQSTTMETTRVLSSTGDLSFWYKVSSESSYDYLKFYIDGVMQNQWSGTVDWTQITISLAAGTRVLKWEYMKDGNVDSGSNCAWIDNIIFPASTSPSVYNPPQNFAAVPGNGFVTLNWQAPVSGTPTGYKIFRNSSLLTTVTGLTYTDNAVVNETSYSYYLKAVYTGGESDPTATVNVTPTAVVATEFIIGTGTAATSLTTASPINVYYQSLHGQSVYTAAELNAAGILGPINITQLGFNITSLPDRNMPNFQVRMGHTTAANVASWISTGLTQVWSSASYLPTATGWNMYTLSTPFLWNGTDNIVIDTAFGLIGSYTQTGAIQYTTVTNGYRYNRSDSADQTAVFTGGSTSTNRPNLKVMVAPNAAGPAIAVSPTTLSYGDVAVGTSSAQQFTISNSGDQTLTGSITTPTGYTVSLVSRNEVETPVIASRNTLSYSVNAGSQKTYSLSFAPTAATAYNGNVSISSNATDNPSRSIAVTGNGFIPPTIGLSTESLYTELAPGDEDAQSFTIVNTGSQALNYSISMQELRQGRIPTSANGNSRTDDRSIAGSTLVHDTGLYLPGTTVDWTFTVTNASTDTEWLEDVIITFPAGVTVNSATNFVGGSGGDMIANTTSGSGITITWHGEDGSGWGVVQGSQSASATVNVTIAPGAAGNLSLPYTINGDVYGAEPHTLSDTIVLTQDVPPVEWLSLLPLSGSIPASGNAEIAVNFSAIGMEAGTYEALITISSNDPAHPNMTVTATMDVVGSTNHTPQINLPESFSFDKNGSLIQSFSSYVSDQDNDPLTLSVVGNSNVQVQINGLSVTFTAAQNWIGSEILTFTVSDGLLSSADNVTVTVNPVNSPAWNPVIYPNNPATLYAVVTIDNIPAQLNDMVAAFVGTECRATGEIVMIDRSVAYTTLLVNLAAPGETISFKIYSYSQDTIYPVADLISMNYGEVYGEDSPVPLNGTNNIVIAAPTPAILSLGSVLSITWEQVPYANNYKIYSCDTPDGTYTLLGMTSTLSYEVDPNTMCKFFKIVAEQIIPVKAGR
jgi:uncharacterized membrane protein